LAATNSLIDEIKALRDSSEELLILLEHIWQNREDVRFNVSVVVTDHGREAMDESLCCYECNVDSPDSLAQALHDGWIDLSRADQEYSANYVGWCPGCQQSHDTDERCLNTQPVHPQDVNETKSTVEYANPDTPTQSAASEPREAVTPTIETEPFPAPPPQHGHGLPNEINGGPQAHTWRSPSEDHRTKTPLLTRLYLHRHMEGVVRAIGYEFHSQEAARERIKPLIERFGRETIESAVNELLDTGTENSNPTVRLRDHVRQLARGMLGPPPPEATSFANDDEGATNTQPVVNETSCRTRSAARNHQNKNPPNISKLDALRAVKFTRKEMLLEFREHLEKQGLHFEQITDATRTKYTDKHIGALDFIVRASGEPPELVAVRRGLTKTQLHDLAVWQKIIGEGATVSVVWLYVDGAGKTTWEVANGETDERSPEKTGD
jgi:hypothetical protein